MNIIDTSAHIPAAFDSGRFDLEKWKTYMDACVPGAKEGCLEDMEACVKAGYGWESDFLPVLNAVIRDGAKREKAVNAFHRVTDGLDERIRSRFGKSVDADVILYLGLCNGAGWVTPVNGKTSILLGIEKIMELGWCGRDDMNGLILHELGHAWQDAYGVLEREHETPEDRFLWQLFTEGIAMVFEQELVGDARYFHQDRDGWKAYCEKNARHIAQSFARDLSGMTRENQRYFGDWVRFEGYGDVGYYLGARFVRFILQDDPFDRILSYDDGMVRSAFGRFLSCVGTSDDRERKNQ